MFPESMSSLHQILLQKLLCVNLEADFAVVGDGERNVAGYRCECYIVPVGICTQPRVASNESVGGWVATATTLRSPEWSLFRKRDLHGTAPRNGGSGVFIRIFLICKATWPAPRALTLEDCRYPWPEKYNLEVSIQQQKCQFSVSIIPGTVGRCAKGKGTLYVQRQEIEFFFNTNQVDNQSASFLLRNSHWYESQDMQQPIHGEWPVEQKASG